MQIQPKRTDSNLYHSSKKKYKATITKTLIYEILRITLSIISKKLNGNILRIKRVVSLVHKQCTKLERGCTIYSEAHYTTTQ